MFRAFGMPRSTFMRRMRAGDVNIPQPQGSAGASRQRRWTHEQLPEIVAALRALKRPVPPGWDVNEKTNGKGK